MMVLAPLTFLDVQVIGPQTSTPKLPEMMAPVFLRSVVVPIVQQLITTLQPMTTMVLVFIEFLVAHTPVLQISLHQPTGMTAPVSTKFLDVPTLQLITTTLPLTQMTVHVFSESWGAQIPALIITTD